MLQTLETPKLQVLHLIQELPDDATYEDIEYELRVQSKIRQGMKDYREGNVHTIDEVKTKLKKWLDE
ncbi:MAG TPA: hypothetical protein VIX80_04240 [Candidatus Kapabacteria bacterium]